MKKTWFITGASRGFGRVWAEAALERGDQVAATARNLADVSDLTEKYGDAVLPLALDVTNAAQVTQAVEQANALVANLPGYQRLGLEWIARLTALGSRYHVMPTTGTLVTQFEHFVTTDLATGLRSGIAYVVEALHLVADVLLIVLLSLFFLLSGPEITEGFVALFPARHRPVVREQIGPLGETLGRYVLGQVINMGALATLLAIGLSLVRLPYALLLAVLAGVFEIVPWLGGAVGLVGASLVALTVNWQTLLLTWLVFTIAHVIQGDLLAPYIQSKVVKIPPAVVLAALVLGGDLMGLLGAILAVPVTAMLFVIAQRLVVPYQDRQGGPAMPTGPPAPGS